MRRATRGQHSSRSSCHLGGSKQVAVSWVLFSLRCATKPFFLFFVVTLPLFAFSLLYQFSLWHFKRPENKSFHHLMLLGLDATRTFYTVYTISTLTLTCVIFYVTVAQQLHMWLEQKKKKKYVKLYRFPHPSINCNKRPQMASKGHPEKVKTVPKCRPFTNV